MIPRWVRPRTAARAISRGHATGVSMGNSLGAGFDWRGLKKAEEYTISFTSPGRLFEYPLTNASAFNWQGRIEYRPDDATRLHASVSRRSRFPTIFERFSTQFGNAASNPGLEPERATNFEIGGSRDFGGVHVEGTAFYSNIDDAIVSVRPPGFPANTSQRQNLGSAEYYGAELALTAHVGPSLELGANYTWTHRSFDIAAGAAGTVIPVLRLTDVPAHKGFAYVDWSPLAGLSIVPSVDIASNRTTLDTFSPVFY